MAFIGVLLGFFISMIISAIIIFIAAKLFGEKEGFGTAIVTSCVGALIFALATYILGSGWIAALTGGVAWLIALGSLYNMGWIKSLIVAVVIWVFATFVSVVLPTIAGPL